MASCGSLPKAGTTAVGKTDLSIHLAKLIDGEIISADSVQVYRHMDIGSAKVDSASRKEIQHHLIDVVDITEPFNVSDYCKLASKAIQDIISRGKVPIVVGGTSFYFQFLLSGGTDSPMTTDESRGVVESLLAEDGGDWEKSLARLEAIDPEYSHSLSRNDWYRLKRGLDICLQSGRTVTSFKHSSKSLPYCCHCLFLTMPRVQLFHRIDHRCEMILKEGFLEEVLDLVRHHGLQLDSPAGRSIGYRQALEYLSSQWKFPNMSCDSHVISNEISDDMRSKFLEFLYTYQSRTRQLSQHQLTWFKKETGFHWLNMAPNGSKLPIELVASRVKDWFLSNEPLPDEWCGNSLKKLTPSEKEQLHRYTAEQILTFYDCHDNIDVTLTKFLKML